MQARLEMPHRVLPDRAGRDSHLGILFTAACLLGVAALLAAAAPGLARQARVGALASGAPVWTSVVDSPLHNSEWEAAVAEAPDGTLYLLSSSGEPEGGVPNDLLLCAFDGDDAADPHLMRTSYWDGPSHLSEYARALCVDTAGNVIAVGDAETFAVGKDWAVVKWGPTGNELWSRLIDGGATLNDYATDVVCDAAGDIYVCGRAGADNGGSEAVVMKLAGGDGTTLWTARHAGTPDAHGDNAFAALAIDAQRNTYATGTVTGRDGNIDILTGRFDPSGQRIWLKRESGAKNRLDEGTAIAIGKKGAVFVAGTVTTAANHAQKKVAVLRYEAKGKRAMRVVWQPTGVGRHGISSVAGLGVDAAGDAYVAGRTHIAANRSPAYIAKWDVHGHRSWSRAWVGTKAPKLAEFSDVIVDGSGRAWVAGSYRSEKGTWDWVVARFNPGGTAAWSDTWDGPAANNDYCDSLCLAGSKGLFVGGTVSGLLGFDATGAKYIR